MIVGGYSLDLYCENYLHNAPTFPDEAGHSFSEFPHQYTDELGSVCRRNARRAGWLLTRSGKAYCPKCTKRGPKAKAKA